MDITPSEFIRLIRRHVGGAVLGALVAAALYGLSVHSLDTREARLDQREARLDEREKLVQGREAAANVTTLENEKQRLALDQQLANLNDRSKHLDARTSALDQWQANLAAQFGKVGIDAQEAALREEARQLVDRYNTLMGNPESFRDRCTQQHAREAGKPLLDRIDAIGDKLRDGSDWLAFVHRQRPWVFSSADCEAQQSSMSVP